MDNFTAMKIVGREFLLNFQGMPDFYTIIYYYTLFIQVVRLTFIDLKKISQISLPIRWLLWLFRVFLASKGISFEILHKLVQKVQDHFLLK